MIKNSLKWIFAIVFFCSIFSCAPTKNVAYFSKDNKIKNLNTPDKIYQISSDDLEIIRSGDELYISVTSANNEPNNFDPSLGITDLALLSYVVDNEGYVRIPYIKQLKVDGLSINQLIDKLETELSQFIFQPSVNVRLINGRFTVLGEVNGPGEYVFNRNSINIYQAIANAGDISTFGNRRNVLIIRQVGDTLVKKKIDLTNDQIIASTWYNVQPNDIIYVEPLGRKMFGMETFSIFSLITLLTSTYLIYTLVQDL
jgi:polysaccharide export outer membrane protein